MKISEFVKNCFNKHLPYFYLLVHEERSINIYQKTDKNIILSTSKELKYQLIKVLKIIKTEDELKFRVLLPNNKKGYFKPEKSILIIPKRNVQVKISKHAYLDNDLNEYINIDMDFLEQNRNKVMYSHQYAIYDNKIYEVLLLVDEIIGFIEQKDVNILHRHSSEFKIIKKTNTYSDNAMTRPFSIIKDYNKTFKTQYVMPSENKIRLKYKGSNLWINSEHTDLEIELRDEKFFDINELMIESILTQYEEKVKNYHKYYNKLLSNQNR